MIIILLSTSLFPKCIIIRDGFFDNLRKISDAIQGSPLTFIDDVRFINEFEVKSDGFSCVIVTKEIAEQIRFFQGGIAISENPKETFILLNNDLPDDEKEYTKTVIGSNASIASSSHIASTGVFIGNNVTIEANVQIYSGVEIGDNVTIKFGTLIGCDDYERCSDNMNRIVSAKHKGWVRISNNVQIDEYVIIDRPLLKWDSTSVAEYTYIGKKAYISHGTKIGSFVFVAPCAVICGNTIIEDNVKIGVGAIISSRIRIGHGSIISIGSVVNKSVLPQRRVTGNLAIPHELFMNHLKGMINDHSSKFEPFMFD